MNVAIVERDQPIINVCMTTKGQRARMPEADMLTEELLEKEVSPTKGQ
jgi:hypothetical protein